MMKSLFACCVVVLPLAVSPNLSAQNAPQQVAQVPQIRVVGVAYKKVAPDQLHWSLRVENRGKDLEQVAATHIGKVEKLIAFFER